MEAKSNRDTLKIEHALKNLPSLVDSLELFLPAEFSLNELSLKFGVHKDTITKHLKSNYKDGIDYRYTGKLGKIWVARETALKIKDFYERKKAS